MIHQYSRESFSDVIIESELLTALRQINPWMEEEQLAAMVHRIQTPQANGLLKANEEILDLLLEGWPAD
jgi:type I site-specific restriction-modification system R (restriction) subunit